MDRVTHKTVEFWFERFAKKYPLKDGYHWRLDKNFIYGGYRIEVVTDEHGGCSNYNSTRYNTREMVIFLEGLCHRQLSFFKDRLNKEQILTNIEQELEVKY